MPSSFSAPGGPPAPQPPRGQPDAREGKSLLPLQGLGWVPCLLSPSATRLGAGSAGGCSAAGSRDVVLHGAAVP